MAAVVVAVGEAVEDEVDLLLAGLVVEAVEEATIEEWHAGGQRFPVGAVTEGGLIAPEIGDAVVLVIALTFLLLLAEGTVLLRHIEGAEEEVLQNSAVVDG